MWTPSCGCSRSARSCPAGRGRSARARSRAKSERAGGAATSPLDWKSYCAAPARRAGSAARVAPRARRSRQNPPAPRPVPRSARARRSSESRRASSPRQRSPHLSSRAPRRSPAASRSRAPRPGPRRGGAKNLRRLWLRGGFPPAYTRSRTRRAPCGGAVRTHVLERDLPQLDVRTRQRPRTLLSMLAHVHGNTLNWSELGRSMGSPT